jgi:pyridoxamine 5'-phosphate oxidase
MNTWRDELVADIHTELGVKPAIAALGTVNRNTPDARCVVIRQVLGDGTLQIVSDARSEKNKQLRLNDAAVAVFWFSRLRKQYRIWGQITALGAEQELDLRRIAAWGELSDSSRALFYWPTAGEPRLDSDSFPKLIAQDIAIPENFEVLLLAPNRVETLELNPHPHLRKKWTLEASLIWRCVVVNP